MFARARSEAAGAASRTAMKGGPKGKKE